jgi:hypothetical protein
MRSLYLAYKDNKKMQPLVAEISWTKNKNCTVHDVVILCQAVYLVFGVINGGPLCVGR